MIFDTMCGWSDENASFKCSNCSKVCRNFQELENHVCDKSKYPCPHCWKEFGKRKYLSQHLKMHIPDSFICPHCCHTFRWKYRLKQHLEVCNRQG